VWTWLKHKRRCPDEERQDEKAHENQTQSVKEKIATKKSWKKNRKRGVLAPVREGRKTRNGSETLFDSGPWGEKREWADVRH